MNLQRLMQQMGGMGGPPINPDAPMVDSAVRATLVFFFFFFLVFFSYFFHLLQVLISAANSNPQRIPSRPRRRRSTSRRSRC
jgi:hypothetical protein